ncbi:FAD-dependent oxidoreductase [Chitinophaga eiseniae]|uniref:FAD-dependent monooxygenase n=1 Tax=Chitinophaga eiseniae TaxID=634771 RepID=A0A847SLA7_9BACT|nr:FAD-dependent oxidoreductase [Chitinophaga eiseniae]NLR78378.1 FAD-dependent monooxygenase [Chitinophaga eiseniae]
MTTSTQQHVPVLIAGGGVTGLSAALFLLQQGIQPLLVERHRGTSIHPRARGFDIRTMELFRELGLSESLREAGKALGPAWGVLRANTLAEALAPIQAREGGQITYPSQLKGLESLAALSPETGARCTQDLAEPILRAAAEERGADLRFYTEMISFSQEENLITAVLLNRETGATTTVTADYLVAADGANSPIRQQLQLPTTGPGVLAHFLNIYFEADMAELVRNREFSLCIIDTPGLTGFVSAINNSDRWAYQLRYYPDKGEKATDYTTARLLDILHAALGMPELPIRIISVLPWEMTARVTDTMQCGRIFLAGDAAHVMTPYGGKGANTGVQDAQNLAWKIAAVLKGHATPALLESYTIERQPIGLFNTLRSATLADEQGILKDQEIMLRQPAGLLKTSKETAGETQKNMEVTQNVRTLIGIPDYQYPVKVISECPLLPPDKVFYGLPGTRVPHLWMDAARTVSTLDLLKGQFTLFVHGDATPWQTALNEHDLFVQVYPLACDLITQWEATTGAVSGDALLVRPDGFVAWRGSMEKDVQLPLAALLS